MQLCVLVGTSTLTTYAEQWDDKANEKVQNEIVVSYNQQIMENVDIEYMILREVENEYIKLVEMYYESGKYLDISIEDFEELYNSNSLGTVEEYVIEQESVIEAISSGVVRSVFDDIRLDEKEAYLKRPYSTEEQRAEAVEFAINQLGKKYFLDLEKDTSKDEKDWYCSELVWAAFKNQGVDLEKPMGIDEPGVTPRDISLSSACLCLSKYK